jgi:hypothetical protein
MRRRDSKAQPPTIRVELRGIIDQHAQVIGEQADERRLSRSDYRVAADTYEYPALPGRRLPDYHQVVNGVGRALLKPHLNRRYIITKADHRALPQQTGENGSAVRVLQDHPAAARGVRTRMTLHHKAAPPFPET